MKEKWITCLWLIRHTWGFPNLSDDTLCQGEMSHSVISAKSTVTCDKGFLHAKHGDVGQTSNWGRSRSINKHSAEGESGPLCSDPANHEAGECFSQGWRVTWFPPTDRRTYFHRLRYENEPPCRQCWQRGEKNGLCCTKKHPRRCLMTNSPLHGDMLVPSKVQCSFVRSDQVTG